MVFQLRHITKVQEVWRFSHNNNSRKAKHSAKMHFALLAHVLKKKTKYRLFLHALRDLRHFLWSVYLPFPSSLTVQCTVFENQLKYLIHLNIDFNAKDLCGKTPFVNACINGHKEVVKLSLARNMLKNETFLSDFQTLCSTTTVVILLCLTSISRPLNMISSKTVLHTIYSTTHCHFVPQKSRQEKSGFKVNFWKELDKWYLLIFQTLPNTHTFH